MNAVWHAAVAHLAERGVSVRVDETRPQIDGRHLDLVATVSARGARRQYAVEVKRGRATSGTLSALPMATDATGVLLVASYVTPGLAKACGELGIDYADAAGNMRLDLGNAFLEIAGRPATDDFAGNGSARLFRPSGLKVLFALLCDSALAAAPYRVLSEQSGASLGSVQWVMSELGRSGSLEGPPGDRVLHNTRQLFDRWVDAYATTLYPAQSHELFAAEHPDAWRSGTEAISADGGLWGGETAAYLLDGYLRPARATVYLDHLRTDFVLRHHLRRERRDWTVQLRERFWGDRVAATARQPDVTPSPLVYADLVGSGDPRLLDAARRLREGDDVLRRIDAR